MQATINTIQVKQGDSLEFNYNGKHRSGKVEKVGSDYLTLDQGEQVAGDRYKNFSFSRIHDLVARI